MQAGTAFACVELVHVLSTKVNWSLITRFTRLTAHRLVNNNNRVWLFGYVRFRSAIFITFSVLKTTPILHFDAVRCFEQSKSVCSTRKVLHVVKVVRNVGAATCEVIIWLTVPCFFRKAQQRGRGLWLLSYEFNFTLLHFNLYFNKVLWFFCLVIYFFSK